MVIRKDVVKKFEDAQGKMKVITETATKVVKTEDILTERGKNYGEFKTHAYITQDLKRCMRIQEPPTNWETMEDFQREALEMIAHKIGRILNGDPNYADSWDDIAGYAKLVADRVRK